MRVKKDIYLEDEVAYIDQLGYQRYVNAISSAILNDELKTPFTIGIYGQWGSGKSSLMNLVKEKIDKARKQTIFSVWFAPWQYQNQGNLLIPLFLTLLDQAKEARCLKNRFNEITKRISKIFNVTAESLLDILAKPLVDVSKIRAMGERYESEKDITKEISFRDVVFLNRLKSEFEQLVTYLVSEEGKMIIFVDDLDRCPPDKVIELLESIKLFIGVKGCIFIIGMNYDIVALSIRHKYKDYAGKGTKFSDVDVDEYLEKIIQLPFRIPALQPRDLEKFIAEVEQDETICDLKDFFAKFLPRNPRKVKKVLNIFRLTVKLAKYSRLLSSQKKGIVLELLAKIIVIRERWLHLYTQFENNPKMLQSLEEDPEHKVSKNLKNRKDLIEIFSYGKCKFREQKSLQQYFTLSEATTALETIEPEESSGIEGESSKSDSGSDIQIDNEKAK